MGEKNAVKVPSDFDKYKVLDNINQWCNNCDTKASIVLATLGVFLSFVFSSDIGKFMAETIKLSLQDIMVCNVLYLSIMLIGLALLLVGCYNLVKSLIPIIDLKRKSLTFFGNIASYKSFEEYYENVMSSENEDLELDLLGQIYAASIICERKFRNQKRGVVLSFLGISVLMFWMLIGFLVYYL